MEDNKNIKNNLQKCYVWLNDETVTEPLAVVNGCYFPVINEQIILWDSVELFQKYKCVNRVFGMNKESQTIVLNIYVEKIIENDND
jgi:hypothetical protein